MVSDYGVVHVLQKGKVMYAIKLEDGSYASIRGKHKDGVHSLSVIGVFESDVDAKTFADKFVAPETYTLVEVTVVEAPKDV